VSPLTIIFLVLGTIYASSTGVISHKKAESVGIDPEEIRKVVRDNLKGVRDCYEAVSAKKTNLYGKLDVEWDIDEGGKAVEARVIESLEPKVDECIRKLILSLNWPKAPKGQLGRVRYPFHFTDK